MLIINSILFALHIYANYKLLFALHIYANYKLDPLCTPHLC